RGAVGNGAGMIVADSNAAEAETRSHGHRLACTVGRAVAEAACIAWSPAVRCTCHRDSAGQEAAETDVEHRELQAASDCDRPRAAAVAELATLAEAQAPGRAGTVECAGVPYGAVDEARHERAFDAQRRRTARDARAEAALHRLRRAELAVLIPAPAISRAGAG